MRILITGVNGFIGSAIYNYLKNNTEYRVFGLLRSKYCYHNDDFLYVDSIEQNDLSFFLKNIDVVIHCAALAHCNNNQDSEFLKVNVDGTVNLASSAVAAGVKRFIFLSTVGVVGNNSKTPFDEQSLPSPHNIYAQSKLIAENKLKEISDKTGLELVIIRSPLVYGLNAPGSFKSVIKLINLRVPLPFKNLSNLRSMIFLGNLIDFINTCIEHKNAANQTFFVSDDNDVSTPYFFTSIASTLKKKNLFFFFPTNIVFFIADRLGLSSLAQSLFGDLQVDISKAKRLLEWSPPISFDEAINLSVSGDISRSVCSQKCFMRFFDILFSFLGLLIFSPLLLLILLVGYFDTGSPLFFQERVGKDKKSFVLVKFRTMKRDTASVASHLASSSSITKLGSFLRKTKLDELPQLWNVLRGEMSLVGPRPCLYNQEELIAERAERGVYAVRPGITGLAQVSEIDMSTPRLLAETDAKMIRDMSVTNYFTFILQTVTGKGSGDRVKK